MPVLQSRGSQISLQMQGEDLRRRFVAEALPRLIVENLGQLVERRLWQTSEVCIGREEVTNCLVGQEVAQDIDTIPGPSELYAA